MDVQHMYPAKMICITKSGLISCSLKLRSDGIGVTQPVNVSAKIRNDPAQAIRYDNAGSEANRDASAQGIKSTK